MSKHHAMRTAMQFPRLGSASPAILLRPLPLYNAADRELRPCRKLVQAATHHFLENPCNYQRIQTEYPACRSGRRRSEMQNCGPQRSFSSPLARCPSGPSVASVQAGHPRRLPTVEDHEQSEAARPCLLASWRLPGLGGSRPAWVEACKPFQGMTYVSRRCKAAQSQTPQVGG
jgi:hypothetical protein